ncbi:hypothetical protein P167DRAFT_541160 [Morchella conica CCBAS932]|uniref:Uncharacterized protein n=1 Tax=Morchella conica CCBAS932 TaxID=1392247 RepID=A0A3N4L5G3_9PEZI|nr:hypothetical protein P167DRAFT_541160 [Morchella conica CCBAS932]
MGGARSTASLRLLTGTFYASPAQILKICLSLAFEGRFYHIFDLRAWHKGDFLRYTCYDAPTRKHGHKYRAINPQKQKQSSTHASTGSDSDSSQLDSGHYVMRVISHDPGGTWGGGYFWLLKSPNFLTLREPPESLENPEERTRTCYFWSNDKTGFKAYMDFWQSRRVGPEKFCEVIATKNSQDLINGRIMKNSL